MAREYAHSQLRAKIHQQLQNMGVAGQYAIWPAGDFCLNNRMEVFNCISHVYYVSKYANFIQVSTALIYFLNRLLRST